MDYMNNAVQPVFIIVLFLHTKWLQQATLTSADRKQIVHFNQCELSNLIASFATKFYF